MSKRTKEELEALGVVYQHEDQLQCRICGEMQANWTEMCSHWDLKHSELEEVKQELSSIDTNPVFKEWKNDEAKKILLKFPRLRDEINRSPYGDEILEKAVNDSLFRQAIHNEVPTRLNILALAYQRKDSPQTVPEQIQKILEKESLSEDDVDKILRSWMKRKQKER